MALPLLARKTLRDLWRTRAQGATVAVLVMLGSGVMVGTLSMAESLGRARDDYYASHRLADLQITLVRAPMAEAQRIRALPGVQAAIGRVSSGAIIELGDAEPPVTARLVSLDRGDAEPINRPWLTAGRWPALARSDEVLVNEAFARARGLQPGDRLPVMVRGRRSTLTLTGIANAPEFVFTSPPGELFPQPERFAILWMPRRALEPAAGMAGAFNDLVIRLGPGASSTAVGHEAARHLARYGGQPAQGRDRIPSARFLDQEIDQLRTMAALLPPAFLGVAAFLLHLVLGRLIEAERANIGLMKAFGYRPREVARGYAGLALVLVATGWVGGLALGAALGDGMAALYGRVYRLPTLPFALSGGAMAATAAVTLLAAALGAYQALGRVLALPPAQALAPPPPPLFRAREHGLESLLRTLDVPTRIVLRRLLGSPRRSLTTVLGLACALGLLVLASRFPLAVDRLLALSFSEARQHDVTLTFAEPQGPADRFAAARLPGVTAVEGFRHASVTYRAENLAVQEALVGLPADARLEHLVDVDGRRIPVREDGLLLTAGLARQLGVTVGDRLTVVFAEGRRRTVELTVAGIVTVGSGMSGYLGLTALQQAMGEPGRLSGVSVRVDAGAWPAFHRAVKASPAFVGVSYVGLAEASLRRTFDEGSGLMSGLFITFSMLMAGGIAFATASVTLAEQRRDLATLRVLGFSHNDVSLLLVIEVLVLALLAVPLGWWLGQTAATAFLDAMATDLFTFPEILDPLADLRAAGIMLLAVALSLALTHRQLDRIDLVESLKSRE